MEQVGFGAFGQIAHRAAQLNVRAVDKELARSARAAWLAAAIAAGTAEIVNKPTKRTVCLTSDITFKRTITI